jgi:hypothetical protein
MIHSISLEGGFIMAGKNVGHSDLRYIPCQVEPGMFRGEWLVFADVHDPSDPNRTVRAQLLVDQRDVVNVTGTPKRSNPANGWLRVRTLGSEKGFVRIVFPQPASPVGESAYVAEGTAKQPKEVGA